ncbi:hypothetical protein GCM10010377_23700 [Streptomyces viridiviolaceus]|nr:hypothetical protein GCM10010377_23700 [Streptomyces viridiviolaceus]
MERVTGEPVGEQSAEAGRLGEAVAVAVAADRMADVLGGLTGDRKRTTASARPTRPWTVRSAGSGLRWSEPLRANAMAARRQSLSVTAIHSS